MSIIITVLILLAVLVESTLFPIPLALLIFILWSSNIKGLAFNIKNEVTCPIVNQLVRCGTSVGANYFEADDAESRKDFKHKIGLCKKESREAIYKKL